jgi:phenylacetate-CoA ligase
MNDHGQPEQFERAKQRLAYAQEHSAFYRKRLADAGLTAAAIRAPADFAEVPFVTKTEVTDDQLAHPPYGSLHIASAGPPARVFCSGGTLLIALTREDLAGLESMFAEMFTVLGVRAGDLVDVASGFHWVVAGTVFDAALRELGAGVIPAGPGLSDLRLDVLHRTGATVLQAFTPYAEALGRKLAEGGPEARGHKVRLLIVGGELRAADGKRQLEDLWSGASAREMYGTSEVGMTAADCEYADGMHVSPQCYLEVVEPETGKPVEPGNPGEVVMTELFRTSQPFIRYRSGDITDGLTVEPCACGRSLPRLGRIIGRRSDVLRVRGQFLSAPVMHACLDRYPQIGRWRVVVDRPGATDTLTLQLAPAEGATLADGDLAAVADSLRSSSALRFELAAVQPAEIGEQDWYEDRRELSGAGR